MRRTVPHAAVFQRDCEMREQHETGRRQLSEKDVCFSEKHHAGDGGGSSRHFERVSGGAVQAHDGKNGVANADFNAHFEKFAAAQRIQLSRNGNRAAGGIFFVRADAV